MINYATISFLYLLLHNMTKHLIAFSISFIYFGLLVTRVNADTVTEQSQELETSVICETGSYGNSSKCEAKAKGTQSQRIQIKGKSHTMADTGLDTFSLYTLTGVITSGAVVATKKFILK